MEVVKSPTPSNEPKKFELKGIIHYELTLAVDGFSYRGQVSSENNLASLLYMKNMFDEMIKFQKDPALPKERKVKKEELADMIKTQYIMSKYAEQLAAALYEIHEKNDSKPKIDIVPAMPNLKTE